MSDQPAATAARAQAAAAILACADDARAAWQDPAWRRRERLGDPAARTDLLVAACARLGIPAAPVLAQVRADATLSQLLQQTVAGAASAAEDVRMRRRRIVLILVLAVAAVALCVGSWILYSGYEHAAAQRAVQHPPPPP